MRSSKGSGNVTDVEIAIVVECKKRLWGGYGNSLVETVLEKSAKEQYERCCVCLFPHSLLFNDFLDFWQNVQKK